MLRGTHGSASRAGGEAHGGTADRWGQYAIGPTGQRHGLSVSAVRRRGCADRWGPSVSDPERGKEGEPARGLSGRPWLSGSLSSSGCVHGNRGGPLAVLRRRSRGKGDMGRWRSTGGPRHDGAMLSSVLIGDCKMEKREKEGSADELSLGEVQLGRSFWWRWRWRTTVRDGGAASPWEIPSVSSSTREHR